MKRTSILYQANHKSDKSHNNSLKSDSRIEIIKTEDSHDDHSSNGNINILNHKETIHIT